MATHLIERSERPQVWSASAPAGGPSDDLHVVAGRTDCPAGSSLRIEAPSGTAGHHLDRTLPPTDLTRFDDLILWVHPSRIANGTVAAPMLAALALGSGAAPASEAHAWRRYLPFAAARRWSTIRLGLCDVEPATASQVTGLRIEVAGGGWALDLGPIAAVRSEPMSDLDAALRDRFDRRIEVDGQRVPAVLRPDPAAGSPTRIEIATARVERANASERGDLATDFTAHGHVLRSADSLVETVVDIVVIAPTRTARSLVIDALLREIVERPSLIVGHLPATTSVERPAQADIDLRLRVIAPLPSTQRSRLTVVHGQTVISSDLRDAG